MTIIDFSPNSVAAPPAGSAELRRLKVAINPNLIDKNVDGDKKLFTHGWAQR